MFLRLKAADGSREIAWHPVTSSLALAVLGALGIRAPSRALATSFDWTNGDSTGIWQDSLNWNPNGLPANNDTVNIVGGPSFPVGSGYSVDFANAPALSLLSLTVSHSNSQFFHSSNALTLSASSSCLTVTNEFIGDSSSGGSRGFGTLNINAGASTAESLILGHNAGDAGTINIGAADFYVAGLNAGSSGYGTINQTSGYCILSPVGGTLTPYLVLGTLAGSTGAYNLQYGTISNHSGNEIIGQYGNGTFTQTAGANQPQNPSLQSFITIAQYAGSSGAYNLIDGSVTASTITLSAGNATFNQSGGSVTLSDYFNVDTEYFAALGIGQNGGTGTYTLGAAASLVVIGGGEYIGSSTTGNGTFIQNGGSNVLNSAGNYVPYIVVGGTGGGIGSYFLNDGLLSAVDGYEQVASTQSAQFSQIGGTNRTATLVVGGDPFFTTATTGSYSLSGGDIYASTLTVGELGGNGTFTHDGGNITLSSSTGTPRLDVSHHSYGASTGAYSLSGNATLTVNDNGEEIIGDSNGTGTFTQTGGTNILNSSNSGVARLIVANISSGSGTYNLSGGDLAVNGNETVGYAGQGQFIQSGGNNTVFSGYLILGNSANSSGRYSLSAGNLTVPNIGVALPGASANFTQTGGNVTVGSLGIANNASNATGSYSLSNGSITLVGYPASAYVYVAGSGNGSFSQSGGAIMPAAGVDATLYVGYSSTAIGTYTLGNGSLSISGREFVGCYGNGTFTQTGGQNTLTGAAFLSIGSFPGANGTYLLNAGTLSVNNNIYVGGSSSGPGGTGILTISSPASLSGTGTLTAFNTASTSITLNGGTLSASAFHNDASYTQSGGTASLGNITGNGSISISNGLATASSINLNFLFLSNTGFLQLSPAPANATASSLNTLLFAGSPAHWSGTLDLANNKLVLQSPTNHSTALANLQNQVAFHAITSSTLHADESLAVIDNNNNGALRFTIFGNQPVDINSLLIAPELRGDANVDGAVNALDLNIVLTHFGQSTSNWTDGNFGNTATIDLTDLADVLNNFGLTIASPNISEISGSKSPSPTPSPEPTSIPLLLAAFFPLLRRNRCSSVCE